MIMLVGRDIMFSPHSGDLPIVREPTDDGVPRAGDETGPHAVRAGHRVTHHHLVLRFLRVVDVVSSVQVKSIVTQEADSSSSRVICVLAGWETEEG